MAWKDVQYENGKYKTSSGGGGGASEFADLDDVNFSNLQNGQIPKYNSTTQKWENANESGGGGTVTDVTVGGTSVVNGQGVAEVPAITAVEANPQGSASINLTKLKVGSTNYNIPSGGGSGHNYSTTEQVVGTWIDGKPVYEKTYIDDLDNNNMTQIFSEPTFRVISVEGQITASAGNVMGIGGYLNSTFFCGWYWQTNVLYLFYSDTFKQGSYKLTVQYTKTTD